MKFLKRAVYLSIIVVLLGYSTPFITTLFIDKDRVISQLKTKIVKSNQPDIIRNVNKKIIYLLNLNLYTDIFLFNLVLLPKVIYNYLHLKPQTAEIKRENIGIFIDGFNENLFQDLKDLNISSIGIRIYITDEYLNSNKYLEKLRVVKELKKSGYNILLVLAQLRESFNQNLEKNLDKVVNDFKDYVDYYQIGEAVNRLKWGILSKNDFLNFFKLATKTVKKDKTAKTIGVSVIDFEWYYTIYYSYLLNYNFDIANSLLYVDRVKEPENRQLGFNLIDKIGFLKAINPQKEFWITETNWAIKGTKEYKPTSENEAVTLKEYDNYLFRYFILGFSSGFVDRIYWWRLYSKGYGLIDNSKRRKSFKVFKELISLLSNSKIELKSENGIFFQANIHKKGEIIKLFWAKDNFKKGLDLTKLNCWNIYSEKVTTGIISSSPIICKDKN